MTLENSCRVVSAMERIADALEQIAQCQPLATNQTETPAVTGRMRLAAPHIPGEHGRAAVSPAPPVDTQAERIANMEARLTEIQDLLRKQERLSRVVERKFYGVDEVAELTGFKPWTIRQACNRKRIKANKGDDGRWRVPHDELVRLQEEGLPAESHEDAQPAE